MRRAYSVQLGSKKALTKRRTSNRAGVRFFNIVVTISNGLESLSMNYEISWFYHGIVECVHCLRGRKMSLEIGKVAEPLIGFALTTRPINSPKNETHCLENRVVLNPSSHSSTIWHQSHHYLLRLRVATGLTLGKLHNESNCLYMDRRAS